MNNTKTLPTDKNGNVYYGPRTMAGAKEQIQEGRPAADVANMMEAAGHTGIARRIRKEYGVAGS
jgi:hypothetical protein